LQLSCLLAIIVVDNPIFGAWHRFDMDPTNALQVPLATDVSIDNLTF